MAKIDSMIIVDEKVFYRNMIKDLVYIRHKNLEISPINIRDGYFFDERRCISSKFLQNELKIDLNYLWISKRIITKLRSEKNHNICGEFKIRICKPNEIVNFFDDKNLLTNSKIFVFAFEPQLNNFTKIVHKNKSYDIRNGDFLHLEPEDYINYKNDKETPIFIFNGKNSVDFNGYWSKEAIFLIEFSIL